MIAFWCFLHPQEVVHLHPSPSGSGKSADHWHHGRKPSAETTVGRGQVRAESGGESEGGGEGGGGEEVADLGGLPKLNVPEEDENVVKWYKERVHRFETFKARETHYPEKEVVVPWQSPWSDPPNTSGTHRLAMIQFTEYAQRHASFQQANKTWGATISPSRNYKPTSKASGGTSGNLSKICGPPLTKSNSYGTKPARQHRQAVYADAKAKAARLEARVGELKRAVRRLCTGEETAAGWRLSEGEVGSWRGTGNWIIGSLGPCQASSDSGSLRSCYTLRPKSNDMK